jgi:hypothetical protein
MFPDVTVRIRLTSTPAPGGLFLFVSEIFYTWVEAGIQRNALSRVPWKLTDDPHTRAQERQHFMNRRGWKK